MTNIADYKIKIFVDALVTHFDQPNFDIVDDDMILSGWVLDDGDESSDAELAEADIARDLTGLYRNRSAAWRAASRKKYAQSERGKAAKRAWKQSETGKAAKKAWYETDVKSLQKIRNGNFNSFGK